MIAEVICSKRRLMHVRNKKLINPRSNKLPNLPNKPQLLNARNIDNDCQSNVCVCLFKLLSRLSTSGTNEVWIRNLGLTASFQKAAV
eukprot:2710058-Amphidinium_carterae.1